jgi:hypothetical protein
MTFRRLILRLSVLPVLAALAGRAQADGKFFGRDEAPPGEPFQRAVLVHADGRELLLIQPQLVGKAKDFAWVIPVPAVPAVGRMQADFAERPFFHLALGTPSEVRRLAPGFFLVLFVVLAMLGILGWPRWPPQPARGLLLLILLLACLFFAFTTMFMRTRGMPSEEGVEVLLSGKVGIYDLQVIRSERPDSLQVWLAAKGYRTGPEDQPILRSYAERGWAFVTARISSEETDAQEGMIDALALAFPSVEPVYPFALTASSGGATEVLLFAFTDHRLAHPALPVAFAGPAGSRGETALENILADDVLIEWAFPAAARPALPRAPGFLTKFRAKLSAKDVAGDLILGRAPEDASFREVIYRW